MKIKYVGPSPEVVGCGHSFVRGVTVEVSDVLGASLCSQESFESVEKKPAVPAAKNAAPPQED